MRKLLRADFYRLFRDKVFIISSVLMFIAGAALPVLHFADNVKNGAAWTADDTLFTFVFFVPVLLSVFSALFIGAEYSGGTMRNKITVGHGRCGIYLSKLITSAATGTILSVMYLVPNVILSLALLGFFVSSPAVLLIYALASLALVCAFSALFTLSALLCTNRAYSAALCILLVFALLFAGIYIISALAEPEFYDGYSLTQGGETIVEEAMRNPNYLSGTKRQIYEFLYDFVPGAQLPQISGIDSDNALLLALYDMIILLVSTCVGIFVFRRKDLK